MLSIHELEVGQQFARSGPRMTLESFCDFGSLLGTDAPIHCDPAYAANTPFGKVIAQGPLLLAPFESWMCELFGEDAWSRTGAIRGKFLVPGQVDSTVRLEMSVRDIVDGRVLFDLRALSDQNLLAVATAELTLASS
ncbi:MaoC family dehydratase [Bradyrhizobium iriomotense]|uniref:MaoC family dehydratase n=1 Tax=Bradyrhizobium iriomotense TaxID=441950 RepID=UPI001B8A807C|nr:MaoC family dehydratase [Bradyrhizobium iriomotense]MBR0781906.1 MaoC family dehydratase [Bradyrhizobium iriomotense]